MIPFSGRLAVNYTRIPSTPCFHLGSLCFKTRCLSCYLLKQCKTVHPSKLTQKTWNLIIDDICSLSKTAFNSWLALFPILIRNYFYERMMSERLGLRCNLFSFAAASQLISRHSQRESIEGFAFYLLPLKLCVIALTAVPIAQTCPCCRVNNGEKFSG